MGEAKVSIVYKVQMSEGMMRMIALQCDNIKGVLCGGFCQKRTRNRNDRQIGVNGVFGGQNI